jgi:hypothetical protein
MKRKAIVKRIIIDHFGMGKEKKGRMGRGRKKNEIGKKKGMDEKKKVC